VVQGGFAVSVLGGFQDPTGKSPKQPGLNLVLALLLAGGWARDLLRSLPGGENFIVVPTGIMAEKFAQTLPIWSGNLLQHIAGNSKQQKSNSHLSFHVCLIHDRTPSTKSEC